MKKYIDAVEKHTQRILEAERYIWKHPETGFKEKVTGKFMEDTFRELGYELTLAGNIPGFYTVIDTGRPGPCVLVLAELDSIICPQHPESDPETGAVHSCGHHAQCAGLIGLAAALKEPGILDEMCGKIKLCAVPAEELLEIEYRSELKKQGIIKYFGGKTEFMARGYFDDVDLAFMFHATVNPMFCTTLKSVGCLAKKVTYKGKASHAGGSPWNGINALYAANCGLNAVNAIRETFMEADVIRVHPIMTSGGSMVNAIPAEATLESYVRGLTYPAMVSANKKVNRALIGAALSLGANIDIDDFPGYAPNYNSVAMNDVAKDAHALIIPEYEFEAKQTTGSGSTDMGDLSFVMPTTHGYAPGAVGDSHGSEYYITDPISACVGSAKIQLGMLYVLLKDDAARAKEIVANHKSEFTIKSYLEYIDSLTNNGDRIEYKENEAVVKL